MCQKQCFLYIAELVPFSSPCPGPQGLLQLKALKDELSVGVRQAYLRPQRYCSKVAGFLFYILKCGMANAHNAHETNCCSISYCVKDSYPADVYMSLAGAEDGSVSSCVAHLVKPGGFLPSGSE